MPKNSLGISTHHNRINRKKPKSRINNRSLNLNVLSRRLRFPMGEFKCQNINHSALKTARCPSANTHNKLTNISVPLSF